jgi:hypothetical protein
MKTSAERLRPFFNLRMHPYERARIASNTYWDWTIRNAFMIYGAQAIAAQFVALFKDFPPRQKPQSFNLDRIMELLQHPAQSD